MIMLRLSITFVLLMIISYSYGQDSTVHINNLDEALALAIDHNALLKSTLQRQKQARLLEGTTSDIGKTSIFHSYDANNRSPDGKALRVYGISQKIPFPTTFTNKGKLNKINSERARFEYERELWQLKKEVSMAYYDWVYINNTLNQYLYLDSIYESFSKAAALRYDVGESTYLEKITAANYYKQQGLKITQTREELNVTYNRLSGLLQADADIVLGDVTLEAINWTLPELHPTPEYNLLKTFENEKSIEWKLTKSLNSPDLSVEYFKGFTGGADSQNFSGYSIGLDIPLWIRPGHKRSQARKVEIDIARDGLVNYEKRIYTKREELKATLRKFEKSLQYYENDGLPMALNIKEVATKSYYEGEIGYMQYIQSLESITQTMILYLEDLNRYNRAYISLFYLTDIN